VRCQGTMVRAQWRTCGHNHMDLNRPCHAMPSAFPDSVPASLPPTNLAEDLLRDVQVVLRGQDERARAKGSAMDGNDAQSGPLARTASGSEARCNCWLTPDSRVPRTRPQMGNVLTMSPQHHRRLEWALLGYC
jgi:hypothetical protein